MEKNEIENPAEAKEIEAAPCETIVRCEKCEFTCDKVITLNKHMNTKHMEQKMQNIGNKRGNKGNFLCDKCRLSFIKKKDLRKHIENIHRVSEGSTELGNNGSDKNNTTESKESVCKCTQETVCDYCLETDGWVY